MQNKKFLILSAFCFLLSALAFFPACSKSGSTHSTGTQPAKALYHCPMHPTYTSDKPGDCPICGMRLVPIESQEQHETAVQKSGGTVQRSAPAVPGYASVSITSQRSQLIGVRTAPVQRRDLTVLIRASARVAYDPMLYSAIIEHQEAAAVLKKSRDLPAGRQEQSLFPEAMEEEASTVRASRLRLHQMGLSETQIEESAAPGYDASNLISSTPGGKLWVYAEIYEYESALVREGQPVEIVSSAFPGKQFWGKIRSVDSILNSETRSLRVRTEISNEGGLLKPEMYVNAIIHVTLGRRLAIPEEALMDTGTRQLAFVITGPGKYEPREVRVGHEAEGYYEVLSGLKEGEQVVVSGNFLIDSESKLKAAVSQSGGHQH